MSIRRWRTARRREYHCIQFVEDVTAYLEGQLPDRMVVIVEAHLALCPHCREYLEEMRTTITLAGSLSTDDAERLPPETRDALLRAFRDAHRESDDG